MQINSKAIRFYTIFKKYKLVVNPHGGDIITINRFEERMQFFVEKLINKAQLIVVPSVFFKSYVIGKFNIAEKKVFVSASAGIDLELFNITNCKRATSSCIQKI